MAKAFWILLIGIIALSIQGGLGHLGLPESLIPQLLVVVVIFLAFSEVGTFGCCMAFVLGLLLDLSSAVVIGPWAGSFVIVYGALALLSQRLFIDSGVAAMVITFLSVLLATTLFSALGAEYPAFTLEYPQKVIGQAISTALMSPIALRLLSRSIRRTNGAAARPGTVLSVG